MSVETVSRKPSISLVVPAFNEEAYLGPCLDAIVENVQGKALEIIVVDNNSTDGTAAIAKRYPGVTYVFEAEKGITKARQCGYENAHGEIVAYVDADTRPPAGWIEQIEEHFGKNPRLAALSGPYSFYDLHGMQNRMATGWFVAARPLYSIIGYMLVGGNFAIRRDVLDKMGGFDASIEFYGEDADIARRAKKHGKVLFVNSFVMPTSGRRLQKQGYLKMAGIYFINFFSIVFRGKPATRGYTDVR
jgi:glycosyltransferase involved in cell wall biosynthesis